MVRSELAIVSEGLEEIFEAITSDPLTQTPVHPEPCDKSPRTLPQLHHAKRRSDDLAVHRVLSRHGASSMPRANPPPGCKLRSLGYFDTMRDGNYYCVSSMTGFFNPFSEKQKNLPRACTLPISPPRSVPSTFQDTGSK